MPSTNGHGPKRAILYARVSTDEQAKSGYSLAQQGSGSPHVVYKQSRL
jgi:DNA invertase Pin-like site-specific DNA recombinase